MLAQEKLECDGKRQYMFEQGHSQNNGTISDPSQYNVSHRVGSRFHRNT